MVDEVRNVVVTQCLYGHLASQRVERGQASCKAPARDPCLGEVKVSRGENRGDVRHDGGKTWQNFATGQREEKVKNRQGNKA